MQGECSPTMAWRAIPLLWHPRRMLSAEPPWSEAVGLLESLAPSASRAEPMGPRFVSAAEAVLFDVSAAAAAAAGMLVRDGAGAGSGVLDCSIGVG